MNVGVKRASRPARREKTRQLSALVGVASIAFMLACGGSRPESSSGQINGSSAGNGSTTGNESSGSTGTSTAGSSGGIGCTPTCSTAYPDTYCGSSNVIVKCQNDSTGCAKLLPLQTCPKSCFTAIDPQGRPSAECVECWPDASTCSDPLRQTRSSSHQCVEASKWAVTTFNDGVTCTGGDTSTCSGGTTLQGPSSQSVYGYYTGPSGTRDGSLSVQQESPGGQTWLWDLVATSTSTLQLQTPYQLCDYLAAHCQGPTVSARVNNLGDSMLDNAYVGAYTLTSGTVTFTNLDLRFGGSFDGAMQAILVGNANNGPVTAALDTTFHFVIPQ